MICKNCGAKIKDGAKLCPVCGAMLEDEANYTLLATDGRYDDVYSTGETKKKHSGLKTFLVLLLVVLLAGGGAWYYVNHLKPQAAAAPTIHFDAGSGIINRDQKVIYVTLDNKDIEFIHGVSLYEGDITGITDAKQKPQPLTSDYEYTKNLDTTFRAIFFDTAPLGLTQDGNYTYTFEMFFSFIGSEEMIPYQQVITFSGDIKGDVSDIIFDHTMVEGTTTPESTTAAQEDASETTAAPTTEPTTEAKQVSADFIYDLYWYTEPVTEGETRTIDAFSFRRDKTYTVTHYRKTGDAPWEITSDNGKYEINGDTLLLTDGAAFILDDAEKVIFEESNGERTQTFTGRRYNSRQNAEDFFGI